MWLYSPWATIEPPPWIAADGCDRRSLIPLVCRGFRLEAGEERLRRRDPADLVGVDTPAELVEQRRAGVAVLPVRIPVAKLTQDARCRRRQERRRGQREEPARLDEVTEDPSKP